MTLRQVGTPALSIGCAISGPEGGRPVFLLHGWPDDSSTWKDILPILHANGWRTFTPYLRGFGPTRFHRPEQRRTGQIAAFAQDLLDLADGLGIERFSVVGHDWGARTAYTAAVLAPERVRACAAMSVGWSGNDPNQPLPLLQTQNYWYQWVMALDRGEHLVRDNGAAFARYMWDIWSPGWRVPDTDFNEVAASLDNPDWADVTLHSYRVRWGHAPADPDYDEAERRIAASPVITVPTLVLHGSADPCNALSTSEGREALFQGPYRRVVLDGLAHFPQRQDPAAVLAHLLPFLDTAAGA
ncbi:MAG: alpha/beta hydrolase [Rhodospirillaceae bacterium]|nr:alpha/beta hydrolase [Rhodospirillales bacterium]